MIWKSHTISKSVWIGFPSQLIDGKKISPGLAATVAANAVDDAHRMVALAFKDRTLVSTAEIENKFIGWPVTYFEDMIRAMQRGRRKR